MSDTPVLAFDTSAAHCAAALLLGEQVVTRAEAIGRGQAERLIPLLQELLAEAGLAFGDLARIGVGTGPGNFTGIRISISAARGLALSLGRPAVGVSTFDAIDHLWRGRPHLAAVPGPREQLYIRPPDGAPRLVARAEARAMGLPLALPPEPAQLVEAVARVAAAATDISTRPAPLYVRPANAAPPREAPPVILDDDA